MKTKTTKEIKTKLPKTKVVNYTVDPEQGSMFLAYAAPKEYAVKSIDRKGKKATVTYII